VARKPRSRQLDYRPWWRADRGRWFGTIGGKQVDLRTRDYEAAVELLRRLAGVEVVESGPTVAEVVAAFRADQFARAGKAMLATSTAKQRACKGLPPEPLASLPCVTLTGEAVDGWLAGRSDWQSNTRRDHGRTLKQATRWAARVGMIARDPLERWSPPVGRSRRPPLPDGVVLERLLEACPPCLRELLEFLRDTGCRVGEARALEARHVSGDTVTLPDHKTARYGRDREFVVPPRWADRLAELAGIYDTGPLLRNCYGRPWRDAAVSQAVKRARRRAGLPESVVARLLRHRWITRALASGVDVKTCQTQAGHASAKMTLDVYARHSPEAVRDAVRRMAG
jgi:integrase